MQKWEYRVRHFYAQREPEALEQAYNEDGGDGWELVALTTLETEALRGGSAVHRHVAVFKRPKAA